MIRNSRQMTAKFYKDWKSDYVELQNKYNTLKESVLGVEELEKELEWWHNLISKHHDNKTCPNLKTYVENLQKENEALKQSQELVCYSCGEPIKYDSDRPECYCNDCIPMDKQSQGKVLNGDIIKELKQMIYNSESPKMDGSHHFDTRKADKLLNKLYRSQGKVLSVKEISNIILEIFQRDNDFPQAQFIKHSLL